MSDRLVLNDIPVDFSSGAIVPGLQGKRGKELLEEYIPILERVAKPKAIIKWVDSEVIDENHAVVDGVVFESVILADKLKNQRRVIMYIVTAGNEISDCDEIDIDAMKDIFGGVVLVNSVLKVKEFISDELKMTGLSELNPGSLPDWPIVNNLAICDIIGNVEEIGVTLRENGYMLPWNTVSGIMFTGSDGYQNCSLCTKINCIGRRAEFNKEEYKRLFKK